MLKKIWFGSFRYVRVNKLTTSSKGFTLIELLVVIAIIGVLVAVALSNVIGLIDTAKTKAAIPAEIATVQTAADAYAVDTGAQYPTGTIDLANLEQWLRKTPAGTYSIDDKGIVTRN